MGQASMARCYCCGQPVDPRLQEDCPRCQYPVTLDKEMLFLEAGLRDLQRSASYGGERLTVDELIRRYAARLDVLRWQKAHPVPDTHEQAGLILALSPQNAPAEGPSEKIAAKWPMSSAAPMATRAPRPVFSLRSFLADQTINIVASLGAFLILIGALSFIATTTNLLLSFIVVFAIHAVFGGTGFGTYRFRTFRIVAIIYTIIYALLVPLVGFSAYRLIEGHLIEIAVPALVAIAATYAAIVYCLLAIYQRFKPFGYLGIVALAVADLALANALGLAYWWWPDMLMLLAFPMLLSIPTPSNNSTSRIGRLFAGSRSVLQEPARLLMFVFVGVSAVGMLFAISQSQSAVGIPVREVRFSLLVMTLLLLCWTSLLLWLAQRRQEAIVVAFLFLACILSFCYAFDFRAIGYALALALAALLYHGLNRFAARLLQPFGKLGFHLDTIALLLVAVVPLVGSPFLPLTFPFQTGWETIAQLIAVALGMALTLDIAFRRTHAQGSAGTASNRWPWLLLLAGFLLNVAYSLVVLLLQIVPVWSFLALTLLLVGIAVVVRQRFGAAWANPLDSIALAEACFTLFLSLGQSADVVWALLLSFAALSYSLVLYQRRQRWLFLPLLFALLALPILYTHRVYVLLLAGLLLPLVSVAIHRLVSDRVQLARVTVSARLQLPVDWEWPLLCFGLFCGVLASVHDIAFSSSAMQSWPGVNVPVALEMTGLSLAWYASAALARIRWWLIPVIGFAVGALVLPSNPFWVLVGVTPAAALLAVGISRFAGKTWALPLYSVALLGGIMAGYTGYTQAHWLAASWVLLAFAALAYAIGVVEDQPLALWIAPVFATWSVIDAAALLGDLYRPPIIALACAGIGVGIGCLRFSSYYLSDRLGAARTQFVAGRNKITYPFFATVQRQKLLAYALPVYAAALAAAIVTGVYGTLSGINAPFYGAVPDALLLYALVAFGVMLFERAPEGVFVPVGLAAWAIWLFPLDLVPHLLTYDLLCVVVFATQFTWRFIQPATRWLAPTRLHSVLGLGGQALIVLVVIGQGGLLTGSGRLVHVGAASLLILSLLLFWYGRLQRSVALRRYCAYGAGLLLSLVVSWELVAFGQTRVELLTLAPASYLIIAAPFMMRDEALPQGHSAGQAASILGAVLLLLPMLWLSFSQDNLLSTLLLAGEALALMMLGVLTRIRIFILSGAALVIVGGLRALFLPSLGLPPSLALTILGITLLAVATGLSLARHRLQVAWTRWE
jgi:hypothetical protein